jgi:hypothetical protein
MAEVIRNLEASTSTSASAAPVRTSKCEHPGRSPMGPPALAKPDASPDVHPRALYYTLLPAPRSTPTANCQSPGGLLFCLAMRAAGDAATSGGKKNSFEFRRGQQAHHRRRSHGWRLVYIACKAVDGDILSGLAYLAESFGVEEACGWTTRGYERKQPLFHL